MRDTCPGSSLGTPARIDEARGGEPVACLSLSTHCKAQPVRCVSLLRSGRCSSCCVAGYLRAGGLQHDGRVIVVSRCEGAQRMPIPTHWPNPKRLMRAINLEFQRRYGLWPRPIWWTSGSNFECLSRAARVSDRRPPRRPESVPPREDSSAQSATRGH